MKSPMEGHGYHGIVPKSMRPVFASLKSEQSLSPIQLLYIKAALSVQSHFTSIYPECFAILVINSNVKKKKTQIKYMYP